MRRATSLPLSCSRIGSFPLAIAGLALLGAAGTAKAQAILSFNFTGYDDNSTLDEPSDFNDPGLAQSYYVNGAGIGPVGYLPNTSGAAGSNAADLTDAYADNAYQDFTLTPLTNETATITSITIRGYYRNTAGTFTLESSATGFGSSPSDDLGDYTIGGDSNSPTTDTYTLSAPIVSSTPVVFRLYQYDGATYNEHGLGQTASHPGTEDLIVDGTVVGVPEPCSLVLIAPAAMSLLRPRRRRRN
jgi:hypothetical protein